MLSVLLRFTDSDCPYLLAIALSVLRFTDYNCPYGIYWPLCCLSFFDLRILLLIWYLLAIVLSVLLRLTDSASHIVSIGHCVVCPSSIYGFWLPLWYLLAIVLSVLRYTDSDCPYDIYWPLCCLSFFDLRILIPPMVYIDHCVVSPSSICGFWFALWYLLAIVLSVLRFTNSDCPYGIYWPLYCIVCPSSIYIFWLPLS